MADKDLNHKSVAGSWQGQYFFPGASTGSNFEAVFIQSGTAVEGTLLDAGGLGEARARGTFTHPRMNFRKTYVARGYAPIDYQGTMGEGGKVLIGYWCIELDPDEEPVYGVWIMYREGSAEELDIAKLVANYPLEKAIDKERKKVRQEPEASN